MSEPPRRIERSSPDIPGALAPPPAVALEVIKLAGDRPDFTVRPLARFSDPENEEIWFYWHDCDERLHQISKLSLKTKRWTNVTKRFSFVRFPWSPVTGETKVPLPVNFTGEVVGGKLAGHRVLIHFGGEVESSQDTTPRLTIFDLDTFKWWHDADLSTDIEPRFDPSMTFINNVLYIFGGRSPEGEMVDSYCVARFDLKMHRWSWVIRDKPYPSGTPSVGFGGGAVPIHGGKKILLTPGIMDNTKTLRIDVAPDRIIVFDTILHGFSTLETMTGEFPTGTWMFFVDFLASSTPPNPNTDDSASTDAVVMASWEHETFLVPGMSTLPELWVMSNLGSDTPQCRRLHVPLEDLGMSFSVSTVILDGRVHLLGSRAPVDYEEKTFDTCLVVSGLV